MEVETYKKATILGGFFFNITFKKMKTTLYTLCTLISFSIFAQIPSVDIKDLDGGIINTAKF